MILRLGSYVSIIFNGIATIASLFLIDRVGQFGSIASNEVLTDGASESSTQPGSRWEMLRFGPASLKHLFIQCALIIWQSGDSLTKTMYEGMLCFFIGVVSFLFQTLTYIWLRENPMLSITITALTAATVAAIVCTSYYDFF